MVGPSLQNGVENRRHNSAKETVKDPACIQVLPAADVGTDMTYMFKVQDRPCVFSKVSGAVIGQIETGAESMFQ